MDALLQMYGWLKAQEWRTLVFLFVSIGILIYSLVVLVGFIYKTKQWSAVDLWYALFFIAAWSTVLWWFTSLAVPLLNWPSLLFLPLHFGLWLGPLYFIFVKCELYNGEANSWKDLKHFILPLSHLSFYFFAFLSPIAIKISLWNGAYSQYYSALEFGSFGLMFNLYMYFSYRFVKYALSQQGEDAARAVMLSWLKRVTRVWWFVSITIMIFGAISMIDAFLFDHLLGLHYPALIAYGVLLGSLSWAALHAILMKALPRNSEYARRLMNRR